MNNKTLNNSLIISTIIGILILYTIILYDVSYDTGYADGACEMFMQMDSTFILIPKKDLKSTPPPTIPQKFEDNLFVQIVIDSNYFLIKNNAYIP